MSNPIPNEAGAPGMTRLLHVVPDCLWDLFDR